MNLCDERFLFAEFAVNSALQERVEKHERSNQDSANPNQGLGQVAKYNNQKLDKAQHKHDRACHNTAGNDAGLFTIHFHNS